MKTELKEQAIKLRVSGYSYKQIMQEVPVSKGILSLWLRDISLSFEAKEKIEQRKKDNQRSFIKFISSEEYQKSDLRQAIAIKHKEYWKQFSKKDRLEHISKAIMASGLSYLSSEIPILTKLNSLFFCEFKKQYLNHKFYDFTTDKIVIEHTHDFGKGITFAINRFRLLTDTRFKILIAPIKNVGYVRKNRIKDLGIFHWDINAFNSDIIPEYINNIRSVAQSG